jgi:carboxyl-terminal processing protease
LYKIDSTKLFDSLKYKTPKGKIVYGGGGILPDIFIPMDTTGLSWYFTDLRYTPAFQNFAFDFLNGKRSKWNSLEEYVLRFEVSDALLREFTNYATKYYKISLNKEGLNTSKNLIKYNLKAEIARQLWTEQGYYTVMLAYDKEIQKALAHLKRNR